MSILQTKNLSLTINNTKVLSNINLSLKDSQIVCVLGANGSGKTSLMRVLMGINRDYTGDISISGKNIKDLSQNELATLVSYLPQELFIPPLIKVREFLELSIINRQKIIEAGGSLEKIVSEIVSIYRLDNLVDRDLESLSGGERQRVKIASVHIQNTPVILLDEPQSFLDPAGVSALWNMITQLKETYQKLVIISTHDVAWAVSKSDSLICLKNGEVFRNIEIKEGSDQEIKSTLENIYEVDVMFS